MINNKKTILTLIVIASVSSAIFYIGTSEQQDLSEPAKKYDSLDIVQHFKTEYPQYGMMGTEGIFDDPIFAYTASENSIVAELRTTGNDEFPAFTYMCKRMGTDGKPFIKIENPTRDDISHNRCF